MKMKKWVKPELYVEEFELSQHVASGCSVKIDEGIEVEPGYSKTYEVGCMEKTGKGHWGTVTITAADDTNGNGKIDWSEFVAVAQTAYNGVATGNGHQNHHPGVNIDGKVYPIDGSQGTPFNS